MATYAIDLKGKEFHQFPELVRAPTITKAAELLSRMGLRTNNLVIQSDATRSFFRTDGRGAATLEHRVKMETRP